jgi:hypothetical protein
VRPESTQARVPSWGPPPRLLVATAAVVLGITTVLAVLGAFRAGITTDEPIHVMRLRNFFDTGWYALDWDYRGAGPGSDGTNTFVYAPVAMLVLHAWSVLWGVEGWGNVATTAHAYDVRHLGVVMIGLVGIAAVAVIGRVLLRHWRWGLVAAAALAAIPMWTGHEMFNVKDVPVATGHTLATLGLLLFVRADPPALPLRVARAASLVAGLVLTMGTRPGMWPGLFALLVVAVLGIVLGSRVRRDALVALTELASSCVVAAIALVAVYPHLFGSPLRSLPRTSESSSSFLDGQKSDRLYVPLHLAEEMPTLLLAFVVSGAVVGAIAMWTGRRTSPVPSARVALVGVQAVTLPVVAMVLGSDLYHGLRQLLFSIPALAVLAAYGMAYWLDRPATVRRRVLGAATVAALALPVVDQLTLQPYQTTYVNLATDLVSSPFVDADNRPGGDFWRVSLPELIKGVPLDRQLVCKATVDKDSDLAFAFTNGGEAFSTSRSLDCREEPNGPLAPEHLPVVRRPPANEYDAVFLKKLPENCTPRNEVTRWRHGFEVVLTILGRCRVEPPTLTAEGVHADNPALGTAAAGDLWLAAVDGWLQWPGQPELTAPVPQADLVFRPDATCAPAGCSLVIDGAGPQDLLARIDGEQVPVSHADGTLSVPISARQASAAEGVWLTLTRGSGGPLGVTLTGLSLAASSSITSTEGQG